MQELFDSIRRLAPHVRTALITGETGTGKELVARALHRLGRRRDRRFVTSNCSAIADTLFESEFFAPHSRRVHGRQRRESRALRNADGGTLFSTKSANQPITAQPKRCARGRGHGEVKRVGASDTSASTSASSPQRIGRCANTSPADASGKTSTIDSTSSSSRCRRCANTATTSRTHRHVRQGLRQALRQDDHRRQSRRGAPAAERAVAGQCSRTAQCPRAKLHGQRLASA